MKVALVLDGIGVGGIEKVAVSYARIFLDLGYDVDIYNLKPEANQLEREFPEECTFYHKALPDILLPDRYMLIVKRWWWGKYVYPFIYIGTKLAMFGYKKTMGKRRQYDVGVAFSGHFRDLTFVSYGFIKCRKKMCWLHGSLISYLILSTTFGDLYRKIKNLCTLSAENEAATLEANRYLKTLNIQKIYNPIEDTKKETDPKVVAEIKEKYNDYFLMVGRFDQDKDQKTVIYAVKELIEKYDIHENMVFVGGGPTLEECRALVKELGLENRIYFTDVRYDVQNFYSTAKLFVHSSPAEGLPTVLLEAMKYELPIVATDSLPGVTEILKNNEYGLKCEVGDPEDMAAKIYEMISEPDKMNMYIRKGSERVKDFSFTQIEGKLAEILRGLQ